MSLKSLFTDKNDDIELASVLGFIAFCAFLYFSYHHYIVMGKDFDPSAFGMGAGGLAAGTGAHKLMSNKGDYGQ